MWYYFRDALHSTPTSESSAFFTREGENPPRVFETLRTTQGNKIIFEDAHIARLLQSAHLAEIQSSVEEKIVRESLHQVVEKNALPNQDLRIRIVLSAENFGIECTPLSLLPKEVYTHGVEIIDAPFERPNPKAKTVNPAYVRFFRELESHPGIFEVIFFSPADTLREGNITNVFAVINGTLITPTEGILHGTMRATVVQKARELSIPVEEREITRGELLTASEIFLSNSIKGIIPVRKWGEWENHSFPMTKKLMAEFPFFY